MLYSIGDKFLINGMLTEVLYTNCGKAWLGSIDDDALKGIAIAVIDADGRDRDGTKAKPVVNENSMAV